MRDEPRWRRYLRFHRTDPRADLDDELRDHIQSTIDTLVASGMPPDAARRKALHRFGDVSAVRATVGHLDAGHAREHARLAWIADFRQDLVYAMRQLRRAPLFAVVAAISIGLGVALNVTIFSFANSLLLRPLPGVRSDGLQRVYVNHHSALEWRDLAWVRERASLLQSIVGERMVPLSMETKAGGDPERTIAAFATQGFFQTLGVRMSLGRAFDVDDRQTGEAVVVLSHGTWQRAFGGDSAVIGRTVRLAGYPFTIVGVAAPEFVSSVYGWTPSLWIPLASINVVTGETVDRFGSLYTTARLRDPGQRGAAAAQLASLAQQRLAEDTTRFRQYTLRLDHVRGVNAEVRAPVALATGFLFLMVVLVLIIACANVANLLLGRASVRRTEIGVRLALGASRNRLVRQLLAESLTLACVGAALGLGAAFALVRIIIRSLPELDVQFVDFSPDSRVFAFALILSVVSAILFGLVPALRASSPVLTTFLRRDADAAGGTRSRLRGSLVGGQVAMCVVLLAVAALLSRSFVRSRNVDPGIVAAGVQDVQLDVGQRRDSVEGLRLFDRITERLAATPGVKSVALADIAPLAGSNSETGVLPESDAPASSSQLLRTYFNVVGPDYFATVVMPLARGREFTKSDAPSSLLVAVINETAARRWWPNADAIGKRFHWGGANGTLLEVVGVARDAKYNSYGEDPTPFVYLPFAQHYRSQMIAHVRVSSAAATPAMLRAIVRSVDQTLPPPTVKPLADEIALALLPARLGAALMGAFGAVALLIAASGIYGVTSYVVSQRTREVGIRAALGATRGGILRLIIGDGMRTVAIGGLAGLGLAVLIAAGLSRVLYGVSAADPTMLLGVPAVLCAVALAACWIPALRATRVDPVTAIRSE